MLSLAEELLLVGLDDERGIVRPLERLDGALAAAWLVELMLLERIEERRDGIHVIDDTPTELADLDYILGWIADPQRRSLEGWLASSEIAGRENASRRAYLIAVPSAGTTTASPASRHIRSSTAPQSKGSKAVLDKPLLRDQRQLLETLAYAAWSRRLNSERRSGAVRERQCATAWTRCLTAR